MFVTLFVIASLATTNVRGHDWGGGSCPSVSPFPSLSLDKFVGLWYVIEQFDTTSTCLTFNYTRTSETTLEITKHRQFYILDKAGLDHTNSYTGSLDIPYENNPGLLRVKWPLNVAGKGDYVIFDTDYSTYAGVYDCQQITFFLYRQSAAILSRTPTLDPIYVDRVKRRLESFSVDTDDFSKIDHSTCRGQDGDFKIDVDENTFKNLFSSAADTLKGAAETVVDGVQDVASTVADGVKNIGNSENVKEAAQPNVALNDLSEVEILN